MSTSGNSNSNATLVGSEDGKVKLKVSVCLSHAQSSASVTPGTLSSEFLDIHIITDSKEYADLHGNRSNSVLCSLLLQMGSVLGMKMKIPTQQSHKYDFFPTTTTYWRLFRLLGQEVEHVQILNEIIEGDRLVLDCGVYWAYSLAKKNSLDGLPFKKCIKVELISPQLERDIDVNASRSKTSGTKASTTKRLHVAAKDFVRVTRSQSRALAVSGKENITNKSSTRPLSEATNKVGSIFGSATNITSMKNTIDTSTKNMLATYPRPVVTNNSKSVAHDRHTVHAGGNKENNIEVIVICDDSDIEYLSDVEDVTDQWRADRDKKRREMMDNADIID